MEKLWEISRNERKVNRSIKRKYERIKGSKIIGRMGGTRAEIHEEEIKEGKGRRQRGRDVQSNNLSLCRLNYTRIPFKSVSVCLRGFCSVIRPDRSDRSSRHLGFCIRKQMES